MIFCRSNKTGFALRFFVKNRIKELAIGKHVVNGGQHHSSNGDNCSFVAPAPLNRLIARAIVGKILIPDRSIGALDKQRLDVNAGPTDAN